MREITVLCDAPLLDDGKAIGTAQKHGKNVNASLIAIIAALCPQKILTQCSGARAVMVPAERTTQMACPLSVNTCGY
jgi:hypothetical protein